MRNFALWSGVLALATQVAHAQVTVYGQTPLAHQPAPTIEGAPPVETLAAYDQTVLVPPPPPSPPINALRFEVPQNAADRPGLSIPHTGFAFFGFSIEMSVITQTGMNDHFIVVAPAHFLPSSRQELVSDPRTTPKNSYSHSALEHTSSLLS